MLTFRRRLPAPAAAPAPEAGFPRLRAADAADMLPIQYAVATVAELTWQLYLRPHGKTQCPDRLPPPDGPRLPQLHWIFQ
jgi:hypothetical protein